MSSTRFQAGTIRWTGTHGWKSVALSLCAMMLVALGILSQAWPAAAAEPTAPAQTPSSQPASTADTPNSEPPIAGVSVQAIDHPAPDQADPVVPDAVEAEPAQPESIEAVPGLGRQTYMLVATLDYSAARLDVVETLRWTNLAAAQVSAINLSVIPAHAHAFELTGAVTADGVQVEARFEHYDTNLQVTFSRAVAPGQTVEIVVPFRLVVRANIGALGGRISNERGVLQFGDWFPVWSTVHGFNEVGDSQATWNAETIVLDLTSTHAMHQSAIASTGALQAGASDTHWVFEAHNVRNFAFAVHPEYEAATAQVACDDRIIQVEARTHSGSSARLAQRAVRAVTLFNRLYGCYAQDTLTLAEVGSPWFSMEFPMMVFIGSRVADDPAVIYHEVAHQWWYGMVGNDQMAEPWLDEAFAQFSAQLISGPVAYCSTEDVGQSIYEFTAWEGCDEYVATTYDRGADFLHHLRARMGDDAFFAVTKSIVATHTTNLVTTT